MIELIIERWSYPDGRDEFFWSVWQDGRRLQFSARHQSGNLAEAEALKFCKLKLGTGPDRITRL